MTEYPRMKQVLEFPGTGAAVRGTWSRIAINDAILDLLAVVLKLRLVQRFSQLPSLVSCLQC